MSDLYRRILLWHTLVARVTGGLALCSAKHRLNREEASGWAASLRNVADEIDSVVAGRGFILDDKGQRVLGSGPSPVTGGSVHEVEVANKPNTSASVSPAASPSTKAGGLRVVRRKRT